MLVFTWYTQVQQSGIMQLPSAGQLFAGPHLGTKYADSELKNQVRAYRNLLHDGLSRKKTGALNLWV